MRRLGATNIVVTANYIVDEYGVVESRVRDPGVSVYFQHGNKALAMCSDRYTNAASNLRSLGLAVAAMRQLERHGGGAMAERAFNGFLAITGPSWKKPWREVFGVKADWRGDIQSLFKIRARARHPDMGGSDALMAELNVAFGEAKLELGLQEPQRLTAKLEPYSP